MPKIACNKIAYIICFFLLISFAAHAQKRHQRGMLPSHHKSQLRETSIRTKDPEQMGTSYILMETTTPEITPGNDIDLHLVNFYSGVSPIYSGKFTISFSPLATYKSASISPTTIAPGKLTYNFSYNNAYPAEYFIKLHLPNVGDSILALKFKVQLSAAVPDSGDIYILPSPVIVKVLHPDPLPKGATKGIKWLRTNMLSTNQLGLSENGEGGAYAVDTSSDGKYLYVAGTKNSAGVSGDTSVYYLGKYTLDGLSIWERTMYSEGNIASVQHTADGGCIWGGDTSNGLVLKRFGVSGNILWRKNIRCPNGAYINWSNLKILPNGDIATAFFYKTSTAGDVKSTVNDTTDNNVVLMKLSSAGAILWYKIYRGNGYDEPYVLHVTPAGEFLIGGFTNSTAGDISGYSGPDLSPGSYEYHDAFILKTDGSGNLLWQKTFQVTHNDFFTGILPTASGYLLNGLAWDIDDNFPDSLRNGLACWWINIDGNGNKLSEKFWPVYKGLEYQYYEVGHEIYSLQKARDGNFIAVGSGNDKYGYFKSVHGNVDGTISKISPAGNILWQKQVGGTSDDWLVNAILTPNGDVVFVGETTSNDDDIYENTGTEGVMLIGRLGITNTFSGKVFIDKNGNHIQDAGEPLFNEGRIKTYKSGDTTIARIFNGRFLNNVDTGSYTSVYTDINNYYTVFPASKASNFTSFDQQDSVAFALIPKPGIRDLQVSVTALTPARPGFNASYRIITKNIGTETVSNAIVKLAKSSKLTYLSASRATSSVTADTISFAALSMAAGAVDILDINVKLAAPPTLNNGDTLTLKAIALPQATDTTPANNQATLVQIVQGSYDPNDKTEAHAGIYTPTMKSSKEPFKYLIRFQNTGTDTAFFITVKDTLDPRMDVNSLETISASHAYKFSVEGNIATWQFDMIKLVDSITNEPKSHGFISFTIQPKDVLKIGDTVQNKAAIYFDFNLPVITNNSRMLFVSDQSVICPGGSTQLNAGYSGIAYQWQVNTGSGFANISNGGNYSGATTANLLLSNLPSSYYGYQYRCIVTLAPSNTVPSNIYGISFANTWTGAISNAWETAGNWSCGSVPDGNTDVVIRSTAIRQPEVVSTTAVCRSINTTAGAHVWLKVGAKLDVKGK